MEAYIANRKREKPRPEVMAHFRASVERNRRLMELPGFAEVCLN